MVTDLLFEGRPSVPEAFAAGLMFVHWNGLHPLHRRRRQVSYKFLGGTWRLRLGAVARKALRLTEPLAFEI